MDDDTASKFVSSLVKTIQSLCNGYIDFTSSIEVIGHIHLNIDRNLKFNYVLSEEVNKSESEAATVFSSHSYHSHPPPSITSGSAKLSPNQNNKADHSRRKSQVAQADESAPLIVPPGFSPASRDSFTSGRSDEDVTQDSASYSEKDNAYSPAQRGIFGTTAPTEEPMDRRRKLCSEMAPSLRPPEPASKRSRTVGHSSANAAKPKFEVIEVKEEPSDDGTDSFHDENKQSAMQDISQPDFSNLVADSLDRVGQMEGASLLAGTDSGQQPPFPVTLHANQAAVVGQPSASAAPVSGLSDPQGGQVSAGIDFWPGQARIPQHQFLPFATAMDLNKVRTRLNYRPQDMAAAISDVQRGKLVRLAAVEHGVPISSLYWKLKLHNTGQRQQEPVGKQVQQLESKTQAQQPPLHSHFQRPPSAINSASELQESTAGQRPPRP